MRSGFAVAAKSKIWALLLLRMCVPIVVILSTFTYKNECTGKDRILITIFKQFVGLEVKKTLLLRGFLHFARLGSVQCGCCDVDAALVDKNYASDFKKKKNKVEQFHHVQVHLLYQRKF